MGHFLHQGEECQALHESSSEDAGEQGSLQTEDNWYKKMPGCKEAIVRGSETSLRSFVSFSHHSNQTLGFLAALSRKLNGFDSLMLKTPPRPGLM